MKKITMIMLLCIATVCTYGQEALELKMKESSDKPTTAHEHFYFIEVTNTSNTTKVFTIIADDVTCDNLQQSNQVLLNKQVLNAQKNGVFSNETIEANTSINFYVKIYRKTDTPLGKWNCIEIKAVSDNNETISNRLTINTLIPDPKNFN